MVASTSIPTILVDSPIRTSPLPLSPLHPITMSPISKPPRVNTSSISMTLLHKEYFPISDSFTSIIFTSTSVPMNIPLLSIPIPLNQNQIGPLVIVQHQTTSSLEVMAYFGDDAVVSMGKYYWSKKDKAVVKKGAKRERETSAK